MAYVSGANMAGTDPTAPNISTKDTADEMMHPSHAVRADGLRPSLGEYRYYADIKREAERNGTDGNGCVSNAAAPPMHAH